MKALSAVVAFLALVLGVALVAQDSSPASPSLLKATFGKLPLYFIENRGVYPDEVKYYVQGSDKTLYFTKEGITFRLKGKEQDWVVNLEFVGANLEVVPEGLDKQQAVFSYFRGPEKDWKTGLKTYSRIVYRNLWPGIDLVYHGSVNRLKYEFVVAPGADPSKIRLRYRGVSSLTVGDSGALKVETPAGAFEDAPPVAYQEIEGKRVPVAMGYWLGSGVAGEGTAFGFDVGSYDPAHALVLDPAVLVYCGYLGGTYAEFGRGIAVDGAGNAYVTGETQTNQPTFPVTVGPDLTYNGGDWDAFVAKVNAAGTGLVYCGYIGGFSSDCGCGIAVDTLGNAYVTGSTWSTEQTFPAKVGPDLTFNSINRTDGFVAKVNPQGTGLVYCGYIGGADSDGGMGIAVDGAGSAYVTGYTLSDEQSFPVIVGPDLTYNGVKDAFVAKVNPEGTGLVYCGYLGGTSGDGGTGIAVDGAMSAYVAGTTASTEQSFPVTVGPDKTYNGGWDVFVAKVNAAGTGLVYCGYVGGASDDECHGLALDRSGNAYLTGQTASTQATFPVKAGPDLTYGGSAYDAFVAKVNAGGTGLVYCGYIGGARPDFGYALCVDLFGSAIVAGRTESDETTFPVQVGPCTSHSGYGDAFVARINAQGTALVYCGYLGGPGDDICNAIAVDGAGEAYVTGGTQCDEKTFPVLVGPDVTYNGGWDAFAAKVAVIDELTASGASHPGGTITLNLQAIEVRGLPYQLGSSLGTGPIAIDTRQIDLSPDWLLMLTVWNVWPDIFSNYAGMIDSKGQAQAAIHIPSIPALIGIHLHTASLTLDSKAPSGIRSISNTFSFVITRW